MAHWRGWPLFVKGSCAREVAQGKQALNSDSHETATNSQTCERVQQYSDMQKSWGSPTSEIG